MTRCRSARGLLAACLLLAAMPPRAFPEDAPRLDAQFKVRRIEVPRDHPEEWPPGAWRPWLRVDFEEALLAARGALDRSKGAYLEQAVYRAALREAALIEGEFEFRVRPARSEILLLDPLRLHLEGVQWVDEQGASKPAVLGTAPDGRLLLSLAGAASRLKGKFRLPGQLLARGTVFDARLAPAVVSRFVLGLPRGQVARSNTGVQAALAQDAGDQASWQFELGSRTAMTLRVEPASRATVPLLLARPQLNFVVQSETARFRSEYAVESLGGPTTALRVVLAPEVLVTAVELDGSPASWRDLVEEGVRRIHIDLASPLLAEVRQLTIQGLAAERQGEDWSPPAMFIEGAVELDPRVTIRTVPPFRAADIRLDGCRQVGFAASVLEGETYSLRKYRTDASIELIADRAHAEVAARSINLLESIAGRWQLTARVEWTALADQPHEFECLLPAGWRVTAVLPDGDSGGDAAESWNIVELPDGRKSLRFLAGNLLANSGGTHGALLRLDRPGPVEAQSVELPVAAPLAEEGPETTLILARELSLWKLSADGSAFKPLDADPLAAEIATFPGVRSALDRGARVWRSHAPQPAGRLFRELPGPDDAAVTDRAAGTAASSKDGALLAGRSRARVRLAGPGSGLDRYQLWLTIQNVRAGQKLSFQLAQPALLTRIELDGRLVAPETDSALSHVALTETTLRNGNLENDRPARLLFEYVVPAVAATVRPMARRLVFPQFAELKAEFEMQVVCPSRLAVGAGPALLPSQATFGDDGGAPMRWGPLSRQTGQPWFNPFNRAHWQALHNLFWPETGAAFAPESVAAPGEPAAAWPGDAGAQLAPGATLWQAASSSIPQELVLHVWLQSETTAVAWVLLISGATLVALVRGVQWPVLNGLAVVALASAAAGAASAEAVWAGWCGSLAAGMVAGYLIPLRPRPSAGGLRKPAQSVGSTTRTVGLGLALAAVSSLATGQEAGERPNDVPDQGALLKSFDVLLPVEHAAERRVVPDVVYVDTAVPAALRQAVERHGAPPYLVVEAKYEVDVDAHKRLVLRAQFKVQPLIASPQVVLGFPFAGLNLAPDEPCLVDGQPADVVDDAVRKRLMVALPALSTAGADDRHGMPGPPRRVEFRFYAAPRETEKTDLYASFAVPRVHGALWVPRPSSGTFDLSFSSAGAAQSGRADATDHQETVQLTWNRVGSAGELKPRLEVRVACMADLGPGAVQWHCRARYEPRTAPVQAVAWNLPEHARVRDVQCSDLSGWVVEPSPSGGLLLVVEFSRPRTGPFELQFGAAAPMAQPLERDAIALPGPSQAWNGAAHDLVVSGYHAGARFAGDAAGRVAAPSSPSDEQTAISVDEFARELPLEWGRPQQAFSLVAPYALQIFADRPSEPRGARVEMLGRVARDRIDWSWLAHVNASRQPRFHYRFEVDERLKIQRVTVEEDGAPRLLRWSQLGSLLVLTLTDRAARLQFVRIDAVMSVAEPEFRLPRIAARDLPVERQVVVIEYPSGARAQFDRPDTSQVETLADAAPIAPAGAGANEPLRLRHALAEGADMPVLRMVWPAAAGTAGAQAFAPEESTRPGDEAANQRQFEGVPPLPPGAISAAQSRSGQGASTGRANAVSAEPGPSWLNAALAALAALLLALAAGTMNRLVPNQGALRVAALGLFWWAAFVPSWLGLLILMGAPLFHLRSAQAPDRRPADHHRALAGGDRPVPQAGVAGRGPSSQGT
jgi:hypothetical protein